MFGFGIDKEDVEHICSSKIDIVQKEIYSVKIKIKKLGTEIDELNFKLLKVDGLEHRIEIVEKNPLPSPPMPTTGLTAMQKNELKREWGQDARQIYTEMLNQAKVSGEFRDNDGATALQLANEQKSTLADINRHINSANLPSLWSIVQQLRNESLFYRSEIQRLDTELHKKDEQIQKLWETIDELKQGKTGSSSLTVGAPASSLKPAVTTPTTPQLNQQCQRAAPSSAAVTSVVVSSTLPAPRTPVPWIRSFHIYNPHQVFFDGNLGEMTKKLIMAAEVDDIIDDLRRSPLDALHNLAHELMDYRDAVDKLGVAIANRQGQWTKITPDYFSMEVTEKFFKIAENHLFHNLMLGIYRSEEKHRTEYKNLLKHLNGYLNRLGVYTRYIEPGKKMDKTLRSMIDIFPKVTDDLRMDSVIDEVESLPYFMCYFDENRKQQTICSVGKLIVWNYKPGGV